MKVSLLTLLRYLNRDRRTRLERQTLSDAGLYWEALKDVISVFLNPMKNIRAYDPNCILVASDTHKTREARNFVEKLLGERLCDVISYRKRIPLFLFVSSARTHKTSAMLFFKKYVRLRRLSNSRLGRNYLKSLCYYQACVDAFSRDKPLGLMIISDLRPRRVAFAQAANACGVKVIYYQYWEHQGLRPPFRVDYGICLGNSLAENLKNKFGSTIINREVNNIFRGKIDFKKLGDNPNVGIVTNANPDQDSINNAIEKLITNFGTRAIFFKPHPRNSNPDYENIKANIHNKNDDIDMFSQEMDLCLCGDTTAIMKIILNGTPCLYLPTLDGRGTDFYGYVQNNAVMGAMDISEVTIESVRAFYHDPDNRRRINDYIYRNLVIDKDKDESQHFIAEMKTGVRRQSTEPAMTP